MSKPCRPWTDHDKRFLLKNYKKMGCNSVAKRLGRYYTSVCRMARKLGIPRMTGSYSYRKPEIDAYIKRNYLRMKNRVMAKNLDVPISIVSMHLFRLGLRRPPRNNQKLRRYVLANARWRTYVHMARVKKVSVSTISNLARSLGIRKNKKGKP